MSDRIYRLFEKHQRLDTLLRLAQQRRGQDFAEIRQLKKLKLAVKDRIALLLRTRRAVKN